MRTLGVLQMAGKRIRLHPCAKTRTGRPKDGCAHESMPPELRGMYRGMWSLSPVDLVTLVFIAVPLCAIACVVVHLL